MSEDSERNQQDPFTISVVDETENKNKQQAKQGPRPTKLFDDAFY